MESNTLTPAKQASYRRIIRILGGKNMARHNQVNVIAFVRKEPKFKDTVDGRAGIVALTTIMSGREYDKAKTGYQLNSVSFCARSQEEHIIEEMEKLQLFDIVEMTGFLATREVDKKAECPNCGAINRRVEACVANGTTKSGGNEIFIYPITIRIQQHCNSEQEAYEYLHKNKEDANRVFVLGNLTGSPKQGVLDGGRKPYTRFQLAINRKYCPKGGAEFYERTDYPWVYSYGDKAIEDFQNLEKGALVFVDGALQARKFKEQYLCGICGQEFDVRGRTLEVLSYDTEYLRLPNPITNLDDEEDQD